MSIGSILEPEVKTLDGEDYFVCPTCKKIIVLGWNQEIHEVVYPYQCKECQQGLAWRLKLSDIGKKDIFNIDQKDSILSNAIKKLERGGINGN